MVIKIIIICLIIISDINSQNRFSVGSKLGYSNFNSSSPSINGYIIGFYIQTDQALFYEVYPRLSIMLMKEINSIIPADKTTYYPEMLSILFSGITSQYFDSRIYFEQSIGILVLNDKSFIDRNRWEYGSSLSFLAGFDKRDFNLKGWKTAIGTEYGLTFTGALPNYLNLYLQFQYNF